MEHEKNKIVLQQNLNQNADISINHAVEQSEPTSSQ